MKIILGLIMALFVTSSVGAAEIAYNFKTLDLPFDPVRINDRGGIVGDIIDGDRLGAASIKNFRRGLTPTTHFCPGSIHTQGTGISNHDDIVGYCVSPDENKWSGFISKPNGSLTLIDYPGALYTFANGISPNGRYVIGRYWEELSDFSIHNHCFTFDAVKGVYKSIDPFPDRNLILTYIDCFAINQGVILGEYLFFDEESGDATERGFFVLDGGQIEVPLPLSFDFAEGPAWYAIDRNRHGQILVFHSSDEGATDPWSVAFYDDGILFDINLPTGVSHISRVGGMNARGQFVGSYDKNGQGYSFVATPK